MAISLHKFYHVPVSSFTIESDQYHPHANYIKRVPRTRKHIPQQAIKLMKEYKFTPYVDSFLFTDSGKRRKLLTKSNVKIMKGEKLGYKSAILNLLPAKSSGWNLCGNSGYCEFECLDTAGRNIMYSAMKARIARTMLWKTDPYLFLRLLIHEIISFTLENQMLGYQTSIRLNGLSDIPWFSHIYFDRMVEDHTDSNNVKWLNFHDYTKSPNVRQRAGYHLTYSIHENTEPLLIKHLMDRGVTSCLVVAGKSNKRGDAELAKQFILTYGLAYKGLEICPLQLFDADDTDLRFLDKPGTIGLLTAKGDALKDKDSGFVHILR
jgi:hypothetical protein